MKESAADSPDSNLKVILVIAIQSLFSGLAKQYGDHWLLRSSEAKELAESIQNLMKAVPSKQRKKLHALLEKWLPLTSFATTCVSIIGPRVELTRRQSAVLKESRNDDSPDRFSPDGSTRNGGVPVQQYDPTTFPRL